MSPQNTASLPDGPLVAWYGDDFTGSSGTLEALAFAGVPSVLFLDVPTEAQMARFADARGVGIASIARAQPPAWMDAHLPAAFDALKATGAPVIHYKVCSTLDSAPEVGSIGRAIDIGAPRVDGDWVPCLIASPPMRRYQVFGHLFASAPGGVFRLDRHPVMARHPITPMDEADVARHLSRQTDRRMGVLDIEALESDPDRALDALIADGAEVVCLDTLSAEQMATCGRLIWERRSGQLFAVGSQGVEYALVAHWRRAGLIPEIDVTDGAGPVDRMIAVSGSVSPVTAAQIDWAEANGFDIIPLDAGGAVRNDGAAEEAAVEAARAALARGRDPLICSARGPDDPRVRETKAAIEGAGVAPDLANARIGETLGRVLARLMRETGLRRAVISGGDSSGHASGQLGLYAFTALAPTIPGAPLLEAHSEDPSLAGLQLALKGGQMGSPDYFGWIKRGGGLGA